MRCRVGTPAGANGGGHGDMRGECALQEAGRDLLRAQPEHLLRCAHVRLILCALLQVPAAALLLQDLAVWS